MLVVIFRRHRRPYCFLLAFCFALDPLRKSPRQTFWLLILQLLPACVPRHPVFARTRFWSERVSNNTCPHSFLGCLSYDFRVVCIHRWPPPLIGTLSRKTWWIYHQFLLSWSYFRGSSSLLLWVDIRSHLQLKFHCIVRRLFDFVFKWRLGEQALSCLAIVQVWLWEHHLWIDLIAWSICRTCAAVCDVGDTDVIHLPANRQLDLSSQFFAMWPFSHLRTGQTCRINSNFFVMFPNSRYVKYLFREIYSQPANDPTDPEFAGSDSSFRRWKK